MSYPKGKPRLARNPCKVCGGFSAGGLGYCNKHYLQFKKYGKILTDTEIREHRQKEKGICLNSGRTHFKKNDPRLIGNKNSLGRTPWNKGKKGIMPIPWNKGTKGVMVAWNKGLGKTTLTEERKLRIKFRLEVQKEVLLRDDYTCLMCGQYGGNLQVDHIKSWRDYPELRFDLDNCRTLCMACHYYVTFKRKIPKGIIWGHNLSRRIA